MQVGPERTVVRSRIENRARGRGEGWITASQSIGGLPRLQPRAPYLAITYPVRYDGRVSSLILVGLACVVFAALAGGVHAVWQRRQQRRTREQWRERERLLNREL